MEKRIDNFQQEAEQWKIDHDTAMQCVDLELFLQEGLSIYEAINHLDEEYRTLIHSGDAEYDPAAEDLVRRIYERWLEACELLLDLKVIESFEQQGFRVNYADEFRAACREVRGALTEDAEFFSSDRLVELRDAAIDECRRGECRPLGD